MLENIKHQAKKSSLFSRNRPAEIFLSLTHPPSWICKKKIAAARVKISRVTFISDFRKQ